MPLNTKKLKKAAVRKRLVHLLSAAKYVLQRPSIAAAAKYGHGFSFTLKNGTEARLYWLKNPEVSDVANACLGQVIGVDCGTDPKGIKESDLHDFCAVKISVLEDFVYLIPFRWSNYGKEASRLKDHLPDKPCASILVYKNVAYFSGRGFGALLVESVRLNASPPLCALIGPDETGS